LSVGIDIVKISDKELRSSLVDVAEAMARKSASRNWHRRAGDAATAVTVR
jgi:hypothetical protein